MIYNLDNMIRVKTFGRISQSKGAWHSGQRSPYNTVVYCTDGTFDMNVENEIFHVEAGDVLLIPPKMLFIPLEGGACRYYVINFLAETVTDTDMSKNKLNVTAHINLNDGHAYSCRGDYTSVSKVQHLIKNVPNRVKVVFERAEKLKPNESFFDQMLLDQLAKELLIHLGNINSSERSLKLREILKYIEHNYSRPLSLSGIAEKFSLSESYVARLFKKELDCKPSEYINNVRVSVAETLLLTTDMSVTEISEKVGYSDVYYFSKTFKRIVGCSPSKSR